MRLETIADRVRPHRGKLAILALLCFASVFGLWLKDLDTLVVDRMSSRQWPLPARVYARPLELYANLPLKADKLIRELDWLGYQPSPEPAAGHYTVNGPNVSIHTRGFDFSDGTEPPRLINITFDSDSVQSVVIDTPATSDATSQQTTATEQFVRLEPLEIGAIHPALHEDRIPVTHDVMPIGFTQALTAVEDKNFYRHYGISLKGILRAAWVNLKSGSKRQGASTITQQLVKNLFLTSEKSWQRKITEAFMAMVMEFRYDKNTILETFSNEVFIAQDGDRAIHGFGLASQYFFDRPLSELTPHQYALLIGMLKAPSSYNPVRHETRALARRNLVLTLMNQADLLDSADLETEQAQPLGINPSSYLTGGNPAYLDAVKRQLTAEYALTDLQSNGLRVFTNYDPLLQYEAEYSVATTLKQLQEQHGDNTLPDGFLEVAVVVTDPNTGEIEALIGGRQSRYAGFNRALDALRPVGSLLKPAVYLSAWRDPDRFTLSTLLDDVPVSLDQPDGSTWTPANFSKEHEGPVAAINALSRSLNLASVNLGLTLGIDNVIATLKDLGINKPVPEVPSLLLGAHAFSVMDMTRMYQTIAADGFTAPLRTIREVIDNDGNALSQYSIDVSRKIDAESLYLLKFALTEAMLTGTGKSAYQTLDKDLFVAGKTGTSDDQRDSWFAGFSGDHLAVVWLGNDNNEPTPLTGSSGALRIWTQLIGNISHTSIDFSAPADIIYHPVDLSVDKRVPTRCESPLRLPYAKGSEPPMGKRCHSSESAVGSWLRSLFR